MYLHELNETSKIRKLPAESSSDMCCTTKNFQNNTSLLLLILKLLIPKVMGKTILNLLLFLLFSVSVRGQHLAPGYGEADPAWLEQLLYRGVEWRPRMNLATGNEFFIADAWLDGTVTVQGLTFTGQKLRYDIFNDRLVILWKDIQALVISSEEVDAFSIGYGATARRFINLRDDYSGISGFAEVIYSGGSMVVARHVKVIGKNTSMSSYAQFRENTLFYLITGTIGQQIRNKGSLLRMFGGHEDEVRRYIRQNHILVGRASPEGFGIATAYYDSLVKGAEAEN